MVGSGAIRDFVGALDERGAVKGVFITTSDFAKPAREAAQRSTKHVRLIDGTELTNLLIEYNVGVINIGQPVYMNIVFSELRAAEA